MHPAKRIHAAKSQKLKGKTIVLAVTGSIAAVETVKLGMRGTRGSNTGEPSRNMKSQKSYRSYGWSGPGGIRTHDPRLRKPVPYPG